MSNQKRFLKLFGADNLIETIGGELNRLDNVIEELENRLFQLELENSALKRELKPFRREAAFRKIGETADV